MNDNVFIAFDSKKTAVTITKMLIENGNNVTAVFKSLGELIGALDYYRGGVLITGCSFDGVDADRIAEDVPDNFNIIVIGSRVHLEAVRNERVFKLASPLTKKDIICSVDMLGAVESGRRAYYRSGKEEDIIFKAKCTLMDMYSMSEEEAYRYIQKKSMDTGLKKAEIAKIILEI